MKNMKGKTKKRSLAEVILDEYFRNLEVRHVNLERRAVRLEPEKEVVRG